MKTHRMGKWLDVLKSGLRVSILTNVESGTGTVITNSVPHPIIQFLLSGCVSWQGCHCKVPRAGELKQQTLSLCVAAGSLRPTCR